MLFFWNVFLFSQLSVSTDLCAPLFELAPQRFQMEIISYPGAKEALTTHFLIKKFQDLSLNHRIDHVESLFPSLPQEILSHIPFGQNSENFTFELISLIHENFDSEKSKELLNDSLLTKPQLQRPYRSTVKLIQESAQWLKDLKIYSDSKDHLTPEKRNQSLRKLIQPYVGISTQGRADFLNLVNSQLKEPFQFESDYAESNSLYTHQMLRALEKSENTEIIIDQILLLLKHHHSDAVRSLRPPTIKSWTDWL